ncbi:G-protein coupled receptor Mth2-like [Arctopsyche grandis]|uniref:G-protein coupled receptor Mth2-like n=1 Tax=Arctopsyche grandis TaxID=121162 RepID=UPI00406D840B
MCHQQKLQLMCFFFVLAYCQCVVLNKCCNDNEGIIKYRTPESDNINYECTEVFTNNDTTLLSRTLHPLLRGRDDQDFSHGFPERCSNESYIEFIFNQNKPLPGEYCIDKVLAEDSENGSVVGDGSVVVLKCPGENSESSGVNFNMTTVNKCCLDNMVYNTEKRVCVNRPEAIDQKGVFWEFVEGESSLLNIGYGLSNCTAPKVVYEYMRDYYKIELNQNFLKVIRPEKSYNLKPGTYCLDETMDGSLVARGCRDECDGGPCVSKCCPHGHIYAFSTQDCSDNVMCVPRMDLGNHIEFFNVSDKESPVRVSTPDTVGIRYSTLCPNNKYIKDDPKYLDVVSGDLIFPGKVNEGYCIETFENRCLSKEKVQNLVFVCFYPATEFLLPRAKIAKLSICLMISCVFLAATLIVYIVLPSLQNLHGKTIMCHLAAMLIAFSCMARVQWDEVPPEYCGIYGYVIHFSLLSAFSWLNVMCFDIWWTFGTIRTVQMMKPSKVWMWFFIYSLYAWGVPTILTIFTLLVDIYDVAPGWLDPNIGVSQCWISTTEYLIYICIKCNVSGTHKSPILLLFVLPVGIQIFFNMIFFILTAHYCNKVKSEIHRMQAGGNNENWQAKFSAYKEKYAMLLKLFVVMGMGWIFEIASYLYTPLEVLWNITDFLVVLQGIPIFFILVLKKEILRLIKKRLEYLIYMNSSINVSNTGIDLTLAPRDETYKSGGFKNPQVKFKKFHICLFHSRRQDFFRGGPKHRQTFTDVFHMNDRRQRMTTKSLKQYLTLSAWNLFQDLTDFRKRQRAILQHLRTK